MNFETELVNAGRSQIFLAKSRIEFEKFPYPFIPQKNKEAHKTHNVIK